MVDFYLTKNSIIRNQKKTQHFRTCLFCDFSDTYNITSNVLKHVVMGL